MKSLLHTHQLLTALIRFYETYAILAEDHLAVMFITWRSSQPGFISHLLRHRRSVEAGTAPAALAPC